jgi:hypothetical protein
LAERPRLCEYRQEKLGYMYGANRDTEGMALALLLIIQNNKV